MQRKSNKFIDRGKSVTFRALHVTQSDEKDETSELLDNNTRWEEQQKYGVYYQDNYNYLQHLKDINTTIEWIRVDTNVHVKIPNCFESKKEEFLNEPGSVQSTEYVETTDEDMEKIIDEDVAAALSDEFDFNDPQNKLEDDFMELANKSCSNDDENEEIGQNFSDLHLPERNKYLQFTDASFQQMMKDEDLNDEEIGKINIDEFIRRYHEDLTNKKQVVGLERDEETIALTKKMIEQFDSLSDENYDIMELPIKKEYECFSIKGSTITSNTRNLPKELPTLRLLKNKTSRKINSKLVNSTQEKSSISDIQSVTSTLSTLSIRPKNETAEERRLRKSRLKDYRKERREVKKINKLAYKAHNLRDEKTRIANAQFSVGKKIV